MTKAEPTKPFKICETYKSAWESRAAEAGHDGEGQDEEEKPPVVKPEARKSKAKKKSGKAKKSKNLISCEPKNLKKRTYSGSAYQPHVYREEKGKFIVAARDKGVSYTNANMAWNLSKEKAALLGGLSVPELVRRRFLPKGSASNPWN